MLLQRRHPADLLTACFVLAVLIQAGRAEGQSDAHWCRLLNMAVDAGGGGTRAARGLASHLKFQSCATAALAQNDHEAAAVGKLVSGVHRIRLASGRCAVDAGEGRRMNIGGIFRPKGPFFCY